MIEENERDNDHDNDDSKIDMSNFIVIVLMK